MSLRYLWMRQGVLISRIKSLQAGSDLRLSLIRELGRNYVRIERLTNNEV